jgi:integrase
MQQNVEKTGSVQNNVAISASIAAFDEKAGYVSPSLDKQVRIFCTGVKKTLSKPITRKQAMTKDILKSILRHCLSTDLYSTELVRPLPLWREAIFELFSFLGMARLDDLLHVKTSDITLSETHMTIFCATRKNDALNRGHSLVLKVTNAQFCPKRLYLMYVKRLASGPGFYRGLLLPFMGSRASGEYLMQKEATYPQMRNTQSSVLAALKLDPKLFGCHSGRRGSCKEAKKSGRSAEQVQIAGGWSENSTTPQIYDDNHDHVAKHAVADSLAL